MYDVSYTTYYGDVARNRAIDDESSPPADQAREILSLYRGLRRHLVRGSRAEVARSGLTGAQLSVVSLIGSRGPMTLSDLSQELELSHSTVSGVVDRLQAKGVVRRTPRPEDRRFVLISLSDRVSQPGAGPDADNAMGRLEAALADASPEERQLIRDGLAAFRKFVEATAPDGREAG